MDMQLTGALNSLQTGCCGNEFPHEMMNKNIKNDKHPTVILSSPVVYTQMNTLITFPHFFVVVGHTHN